VGIVCNVEDLSFSNSDFSGKSNSSLSVSGSDWVSLDYVSNNESGVDHLNVVRVNRWLNDNGWNLDDGWLWAGVLLVDLEREDDVSSNNLSDDDSVGLVEGGKWCQEMSSHKGIVNVNVSGSDDVVDNSSWNGWERSSGDFNIGSSSDVDEPSGLEVAVSEGGVSELSNLSWGQRDNVISGRGRVTGDGQTRPLDGRLNIIWDGGNSGGISSVANLGISEFLVN